MDKLLIRPLIAVLISLLIPARSYRRKSLDPSGAIAGFAVMTIRIAVGYRYGSLLLVFFFTSSKLTKVGKTRSGASMPTSKRLGAGLIQQWDCFDLGSGSLGKIGIAGEMLGLGRLPVQKGTNGGVTKAGLLAAAGSVIGLTFVVFGFLTTKCAYDVALKQLLVIPISTLAALGGSVIDSLLGATLQFSGFCTVRNKVVGQKLRKSQAETVLATAYLSGAKVIIRGVGKSYTGERHTTRKVVKKLFKRHSTVLAS
ncbi:hypothetical protein TB1_025600 [Malus domestica]